MSLLFFGIKALLKGCFVTGKTPKFNVCAANLKIELESCCRRFRTYSGAFWVGAQKKLIFFRGPVWPPLLFRSSLFILFFLLTFSRLSFTWLLGCGCIYVGSERYQCPCHTNSRSFWTLATPRNKKCMKEGRRRSKIRTFISPS